MIAPHLPKHDLDDLLASSPPAGVVPADLLRRHQFAHLVQAVPLLSLVVIVGVLAMVYAFRSTTPVWLLTAWAASLALPASYSLVRYIRRRNRPIPEKISQRTLNRAFVRFVLAGLLWGLAEWILGANATPMQHLFLAVVLAGMAAGVVMMLYPLPAHCIGFAVAAAPAGLQCMLRARTETDLAIGILLLLFLLVAGMVAASANRRFRESIAIRLDLVRSRRLLLDALEASDEAFAIFDAGGEKLYANRRFEQSFPAGRRFDHALDEPITEQLADGREHRLSVRPTADGGLVAVATDITALKQTERELAASNMAKSQFLSVMSHELKTPLNGVIGFAELIGVEAAQRDLPQIRDYAMCILGSGRRLHGLLSDILLHTEIESGRYEPREDRESLDRIVARAVARKTFDLQERPSIQESVPENIEIFGDIRAFDRILDCLLANAVKFTPSDGEIEISLRPAGDELDLVVRDSGCGIEPEHLETIFHAFAQGDNTSRRSHEGAGLGLAIARGLARRTGGELRIESTPGAGTRAWFTIPAACIGATDPKRRVADG